MNSFVRFVSVALLVAIASVAGAQTNVTIHGEVVNGAGK